MHENDLHQKALSYHQAVKIDEEIDAYKKIIKSNPQDIIALSNLVNLFIEKRKIKSAYTFLKQLLHIRPDFINNLFNHSNLLVNNGNINEAIVGFSLIIKIIPDHFESLNNYGYCLELSKQFNKAIDLYKKAIKIKPSFVEAHNNLGNCLMALYRYDEAIESYQKALKYNPNFINAHNNLGFCFQQINKIEEAFECYKNALKINPNHVDTNWNLSLLQLLTGDFENGWKNYEWRKKKKDAKNNHFYGEKITWTIDKEIKGKTIYISTEQGIGDYIQFCRYLNLLNDLGAKIILDTPPRIRPLIKRMGINFSFIEEMDNKKFQYHCSLISLPLAFKTKLNTIPKKIPYLYTSKEKREFWKKKLGNKSKIRIGLMHTTHLNDQKRSLKLRQLEPILNMPFEFHSFQISLTNDDKKYMMNLKNFYHHKDDVIDFDSVSALIEEMDLIITVGQTITHLCGALGKTQWVLLPFSPSFRWMLNRDDSPWYPQAKLYRQPKIDDWESVIQQMVTDLNKLFKV